jgi:hypothetical protein
VFDAGAKFTGKNALDGIYIRRFDCTTKNVLSVCFANTAPIPCLDHLGCGRMPMNPIPRSQPLKTEKGLPHGQTPITDCT